MKTKIIIIILIILLVGLILYFVFNFFKPKGRSEYCDSNGCIPKEVFRKLPEYPSDFENVKINGLGISKRYPDEYYYEQPEFLGNSFLQQGLSYYTLLSKPQNFTYLNVAGYGAYSSDIKLEAKEGEYEVVSYVHASWGVVKYQGLSLDVVYLNKSEIAEECFNVTLIPNTLLLGRTYLSFDPNWVQKVEIKIRVDKGCPNGDYIIGIMPTNAPEEFEDEWVKVYGNGYMSLGLVGTGRPLIQIFLTKTL